MDNEKACRRACLFCIGLMVGTGGTNGSAPKVSKKQTVWNRSGHQTAVWYGGRSQVSGVHGTDTMACRPAFACENAGCRIDVTVSPFFPDVMQEKCDRHAFCPDRPAPWCFSCVRDHDAAGKRQQCCQRFSFAILRVEPAGCFPPVFWLTVTVWNRRPGFLRKAGPIRCMPCTRLMAPIR